MTFFLQDTFAGSGRLQDHLPNVGGIWTRLGFDIDGYTQSNYAIITSSLLKSFEYFSSDSRTPFYRNAAVAATADYEVEATLVFPAATYAQTGGIGIRASASGTTNATVDRYQIYATRTSDTVLTVRLEKVVAGVRTVLGSYAVPSVTAGNNKSLVLKIKADGTTIKGYVDGTERISVTDTAISQIGTVIIAPPASFIGQDVGYMSNLQGSPELVPVAPTGDSSVLTITDTATIAVVQFIAPTGDSSALTITDNATLLVLVIKTPTGDSSALSIDDTAVVVRQFSLSVKVGLLCDVEMALMDTSWHVGSFLTATAPGALINFTYDSSRENYAIYLDEVTENAYQSAAKVHLGSLFASSLNQRGIMRLYINASLEAGGPVAVRGVVQDPTSRSTILTQDSNEQSVIGASMYRRMNGGIFSWPPALGGGSKYRSGHVTSKSHTNNLEELDTLRLQAISIDENDLAMINILSMDILPVEHGFFAGSPIKESEVSALQRGEILVMDGISNPPGGYVVHPTQAPSSSRENLDLGGSVPIIGAPFYMEPAKANVMTILCDWWDSVDDLGGTNEEAVFHTFIEYEPRVLFL